MIVVLLRKQQNIGYFDNFCNFTSIVITLYTIRNNFDTIVYDQIEYYIDIQYNKIMSRTRRCNIIKKNKTKRRRYCRKHITNKLNINKSIPTKDIELKNLIKMINRNIKGGGNFIDPKSFDECFVPLTKDTFEFTENITYEQLSTNLKEMIKFGQGEHNDVYSTKGINKCNADIPIIFRISKKSVIDIEEDEREDKIANFRKEMEITADLNGILPNLYMCGTIIKEGDIYTFAIMESKGKELDKWLKTTQLSEYFLENIFKKVLGQYRLIADRGYCNIDAKPENCLISIVNGEPFITIIDMDSRFIIELNDNKYGNKHQLYYLLMSYIFLNYIIYMYCGNTHSFNRAERIMINSICNRLLMDIESEPGFNGLSNYINDNMDGVDNPGHKDTWFQLLMQSYEIPIPPRPKNM